MNNLKSTGIIRKVDELGRVVIPKSTRTTLGIEIGTPIEIYIDEGRLIFEKHVPNLEKEVLVSNLKSLIYNNILSEKEIECVEQAIDLIK